MLRQTVIPVGNRLSSLGVSPYTYNSSNELQTIPGVTYAWDNNGNLQTKTDATGATGYTWDYENRLTQVSMPGTAGTVNYKYDPFGRRVQKVFTQGGNTTTTNYVYDGANMIEELDQFGAAVARYVQGPGIDAPLTMVRGGTVSYYEQDGLGSVTSLSNSAGALVNTYTYDSFGKATASSGTITNPFRYTGRELDAETGMYYYRARYYDQNLGRFIGEDPARYSSGGTHFYFYVANNPVLFSDYFGLCKVEVRFFKLGINWYHAYVVTTDIDGSQYFLRGGPSAGGPSGGSSGALGSASGGSSSGSSGRGSSGSSNSANSTSPGAGRGGAGRNNGPWGPIQTWSGPYVPGTIDWDPTNPPSVVVSDDGEPCGCINNRLSTALNQIQNANIPYNPFTTNSNATAREILDRGGLVPPKPPVWVPGWQTKLP